MLKIDKNVISSDLALAEGIMHYLQLSMEVLELTGATTEEVMGPMGAANLIGLLRVLGGRTSGMSLDEAIKEADRLIEIDVAVVESEIIDNNPFLRKM